MTGLLLDTDILINWLRGERWEQSLLLTPGVKFYYAQLTRKELFQYKSLTRTEAKRINYLLNCLRQVPLSPAIAAKSSQLLQTYRKRGLTAADALIAATAWEKNLALVTKNKRHFTFIKEIRLAGAGTKTRRRAA